MIPESDFENEFSHFLNSALVDSDGKSLHELIQTLQRFLPDANCCLLLLYKYAGHQII